MAVPQFHPEAARLIFVVLSFEGPDRYAMAGGLATRVTGLAEALARLGFETHLIFVGYAYNKACLTGNRALIDIALWLCQSDHLHLSLWYGRSGAEAEVSSYFTPREW